MVDEANEALPVGTAATKSDLEESIAQLSFEVLTTMSAVSAYIRAKLLGLEDHNPEAARQAAEHYLRQIAGKDDRRILWLVEGAANALAEELEAEEAKITRHTTFKREQEAAKCQERLDRLTEDFRFLWALIILCREQHFQKSAVEFGEWIKRQRKPRKSD